MKNLIHSVLLGLVAVMGGVLITSCDDEQLTKRLAKNALEEHAQFRDSSMTVSFSTGYYEVDETGREQLLRLQKAEMVTCKFDTVIEKRRHYSWYDGETFEDVPHAFATVAFTEKGQKYVVTNKPMMREDQEEDMKLLEGNKELQLPDYMTAIIAAATAPEKTETSAPEPVEEDFTPAPAEPKTAYELAREKANAVQHDMLAGYVEIVKVKEVFCPEEMRKNGKGNCIAICEFVDRTPFGWVLGNMREGQRALVKANLVHYEDMGWVVTDLDDND